MANNHEQFIAFNDTIKASKSRRDTLKKNRESIRNKIRNYFKNNWPDKILCAKSISSYGRPPN